MTLFLLEAFALLTNTSNRGGGEDQGNKNQIQPLFKVVQTTHYSTQVHSSNLPPSPPPAHSSAQIPRKLADGFVFTRVAYTIRAYKHIRRCSKPCSQLFRGFQSVHCKIPRKLWRVPIQRRLFSTRNVKRQQFFVYLSAVNNIYSSN